MSKSFVSRIVWTAGWSTKHLCSLYYIYDCYCHAMSCASTCVFFSCSASPPAHGLLSCFQSSQALTWSRTELCSRSEIAWSRTGVTSSRTEPIWSRTASDWSRTASDWSRTASDSHNCMQFGVHFIPFMSFNTKALKAPAFFFIASL